MRAAKKCAALGTNTCINALGEGIVVYRSAGFADVDRISPVAPGCCGGKKPFAEPGSSPHRKLNVLQHVLGLAPVA
jgi:hypothetical protein